VATYVRLSSLTWNARVVSLEKANVLYNQRDIDMNSRSLAIVAVIVSLAASLASAQDLTTDAERSWRDLRNSEDVKTKLMAERWYSAIRQQDWGDASGKFKTSAKYVEHDPQLAWVKLRVIQGAGDKRVVKDVQIPLEKLNKVCQARVRQIAKLSEKVTAAIEEEKNKEAEDKTDGTSGEMIEDSRGSRGEFDDGAAGVDPEQLPAERGRARGRRARQPSAPASMTITNDGPPLPALLPPLPTRIVASEVAEPIAPPSRDAEVAGDSSPDDR
jgi:hypothetical protein